MAGPPSWPPRRGSCTAVAVPGGRPASPWACPWGAGLSDAAPTPVATATGVGARGSGCRPTGGGLLGGPATQLATPGAAPLRPRHRALSLPARGLQQPGRARATGPLCWAAVPQTQGSRHGPEARAAGPVLWVRAEGRRCPSSWHSPPVRLAGLLLWPPCRTTQRPGRQAPVPGPGCRPWAVGTPASPASHGTAPAQEPSSPAGPGLLALCWAAVPQQGRRHGPEARAADLLWLRCRGHSRVPASWQPALPAGACRWLGTAVGRPA